MRIIYRFDVVEIRSPILDISFLSAGYQPVVTMRPCGGCDAGLELIVVSLSSMLLAYLVITYRQSVHHSHP